MSEKILMNHEKYSISLTSGDFVGAKEIVDNFYSHVFEEYKRTEDISERKNLSETLTKAQKASLKLDLLINAQERKIRGVN